MSDGPIQVIRVEGLAELNRSLRSLSSDAPKALRTAHNRAAQLVVDAARPRVPIGPGKGGHARDTIRVASTRTQTRVRAGSKRSPYYPWLDFGGSVGRNRSVKRPFLRQGRYVYRAYNENRGRIESALADALDDVIRSAGLD